MKRIVQAVAGLSLAVLTACGPLGAAHPFAGAVGGLFGGGSDSAQQAAAGLGSSPSREQIEAQPVDLLRVSIISREATAVFGQAGANGNTITWFSTNGLSLTFANGLLVGTRGFGDDLMGADVSGAVASLNTGGNHLRTMEFLDGLGQIVQKSYSCSTVRGRADRLEIFERFYNTTIIEETCTSEDHTFKNTYWRDRAGIIWQSRQWISPQVGFLGYQRL